MTATISPATNAAAKPNLLPSPEASPRPTMPDAIPMATSSDASNSRPANWQSAPGVRPPGGSDTPATSRPTQPGYGSSRGAGVPDPAAKVFAEPIHAPLLDPALNLAAEVLDDIERVRMANENRVRQMTRSTEDKDGEVRGLGYKRDHADVVRLVEIVENLKVLEHKATLELQRKMRKHPLGAYQKAHLGVGEKQLARLLATIGDPYINSAKDAPRTVSALWAYCGLHVLPAGPGIAEAHVSSAGRNRLPDGQGQRDDQLLAAVGDQHRDTDQVLTEAHRFGVGVAAKRRKGERANWSTNAKTRAHLIAQKCSETLSPDCKASRDPAGPVWAIPGHLIEDCRDGHVNHEDRLGLAVAVQEHPQDQAGHQSCEAQPAPAELSCGCSPYRVVYDRRRAHTALTHPEWTDGHSHNDGLRIASKAILKDLWRAARDWHLTQESETTMTEPTPMPTEPRPIGPSPTPNPRAA